MKKIQTTTTTATNPTSTKPTSFYKRVIWLLFRKDLIKKMKKGLAATHKFGLKTIDNKKDQ